MEGDEDVRLSWKNTWIEPITQTVLLGRIWVQLRRAGKMSFTPIFLFSLLHLTLERERGGSKAKAKKQASVTAVVTGLKTSWWRTGNEDGRALRLDTKCTWALLSDCSFISMGQWDYDNSGRWQIMKWTVDPVQKWTSSSWDRLEAGDDFFFLTLWTTVINPN